MALPVYAGSERRCGLPTSLHTFHDILGHSGNGNRVFHRLLGIPVAIRWVLSRRWHPLEQNKVLDRVQRDLGRIFNIKLLLGCLRLDA